MYLNRARNTGFTVLEGQMDSWQVGKRKETKKERKRPTKTHSLQVCYLPFFRRKERDEEKDFCEKGLLKDFFTCRRLHQNKM